VRAALKPVEWLGDSLERVKSFPVPARQKAGFELEMVQHGSEPADWRPMPAVGPGVNEIRIHVEGEYRVLYVVKFDRAVYVLHAFRKRLGRPLAWRSALARLAIKRCFEGRA
jgi:phage-related protein